MGTKVQSRLKQVSALLTLLLTALLTGPSLTDAGLFSRSPSDSYVKFEVAQGAASLGGNQPLRDSARQQADEEGDSADPAILKAGEGGIFAGAAPPIQSIEVAEAPTNSRRANQARAPPSV
jgi:hypothetical protein